MECFKLEKYYKKENLPHKNYGYNDKYLRSVNETRINLEKIGNQKLKSKYDINNIGIEKEDLENFKIEEISKENYFSKNSNNKKTENILQFEITDQSFDEEKKNDKNFVKRNLDYYSNLNIYRQKIDNNFKNPKERGYSKLSTFSKNIPIKHITDNYYTKNSNRTCNAIFIYFHI